MRIPRETRYVRSFVFLLSTLSGSSSEDSGDETAVPLCSYTQSLTDSSSEEEEPVLKRVRRNRKKGITDKVRAWQKEEKMNEMNFY